MAFSSLPFYFRLVSILVSFFCFVIVSRFPVFRDLFLQVEREFLTSLEGMRGDLFFLYTHETVDIMWRRRCQRFGSEMDAKSSSPDSISSREETKYDSTGFPSQGLRWRLANVLVSHMISRTISWTRSGRKRKIRATSQKIYVYRSRGLLCGLLTAGSVGWTCWAAAYVGVAAARRWSAMDASGALCDGDGAFSFDYQLFRPWRTAKRFLNNFNFLSIHELSRSQLSQNRDDMQMHIMHNPLHNMELEVVEILFISIFYVVAQLISLQTLERH